MEEIELPSFSIYGLQWCFKELDKEEFQRFKELLMEETSELAKGHFPWFEVMNANTECLASLLHEYYIAPLAWKVSINIFEKMNLSELAEKAKDEMEKYTQDEILEDSEPIEFDEGPSKEVVPGKWDYKHHVMTKFSADLDMILPFEESVTHWPQMQILVGAFHPDGSGSQPRTVVLHGKSGTGKSILARRVMLYWAQDQLYKGMFSYVFFLHAREIQWLGEGSLAELISREWPDSQAPVSAIMSQPEKLLFVLDSFDDLGFVLKDGDEKTCRDWAEKQPVSVLMRSLLKKVLLPECSLMITIRDVGVGKLKSEIVSPRYLLVGGISVEQRIKMISEHVKDEHQKLHILNSVMDNDQLFDKCQVFDVCSLICVALQQAERNDLSATCQTFTSLYATFMFHQLTPQNEAQRCLNQKEQAVLKGLCLMALEGVWHMKFVFYGDDLGFHGLEESELSTLFRMKVLPQDILDKRCYTFFHLSLQEFCAALCYVLEGIERDRDPYPLSIGNVRSLMELTQIDWNPHLLQMKRFLFGLMNRKSMSKLETLLGCRVPLEIKQELLQWVSLLGKQAKAPSPLDILDSFHCLFETQDEEFVRLALEPFQEVWLPINQQMDLLVSSFCLQYCQHLQKIRLSVKEIFSKDEVTEAQPINPSSPQGRIAVAEWWRRLCSVLSSLVNLRLLDLSCSVLSEWAMKSLCAKLRHPTCKIETLILKDAQIALGLQHLWAILITNRNLKLLNLEGTCLKDGDVEAACAALKHRNCFLESLRLNSCGLTHTCCLMISRALVVCTSLKSLSLTGNNVTDKGLRPLCEALKYPTCNLQKLALGHCGLTESSCQDLAIVFIINQNLTRLYLAGNNLGNDGVKALCRFIKHPSCYLQRLILNQCNLQVASCGFLALALISNRSLTHLSLSLNTLQDDGMNLLCEVMREPYCHLQDLEVVGCCLSATCCEGLSSVVTRSSRLASLDLSSNDLGDRGVIALCEGLKQETSALRRLGLEACALSSASCEALSSALCHNRNLTSLKLMQNHFSGAGLTKLCMAFQCPTSSLQVVGMWKMLFTRQQKSLLEEVKRLKPNFVIDENWYALDEDDRFWWQN
ncbi:NACHT, LRR and PYD domains-containing protein 5 [Choloepus didactylus]|uniref:NACHT, LRR and PYD domains-containing protein 5 n=1 Tax=Choloepus didactylus TaxID=27675 RepID=UPI00189E13DA|nr:NACHT, LRR and PYD domains-containing protein 5 [Choloepus didactylus]